MAVRILFAALALAVFVFPRMSSSQSEIYYENQVAILNYHHIDEQVTGNITITPQLFRDQLVYLQKKGYRFITLSQFHHFLKKGERLPPNALLVTFDDGYRSFYQYAFPILNELKIPAVNFVMTKELTKERESGKLAFLNAGEIAEMTGKSDLIEVQCHSDRLHEKDPSGTPLLLSRQPQADKQESEQEYESRIVRDTRSCVSQLDAIQKRPHYDYAYPFGMYDAVAAGLIRQAGIEYAYTTSSEMTLQDTDPMNIPRINAGAPTVTPESLHQLLLNKPARILPADELIPLGKAINQMGGNLVREPGGILVIEFGTDRWSIERGSKTARNGDRTVELNEPLRFEGKKNYIRHDDLETLLKGRVVYNPIRDLYYIHNAPRRR
ncbi:polysaccharide deacetylase family protein [Paenibacillus sp. J31TS4]|uniref:polysaccharide deacetylase family protein n=1 Tax=Paenibacillus sp. J31TS4 TaxID=2807195 RepID=UPI0020C01E00|nr:polysaccharide deacetylase family protein [Paenibacillus sp. J31TS4]